jgi:hypothetical protein
MVVALVLALERTQMIGIKRSGLLVELSVKIFHSAMRPYLILRGYSGENGTEKY